MRFPVQELPALDRSEKWLLYHKIVAGIIIYLLVFIYLSACQCSPFPVDNMSIFHGISSGFAYILFSEMKAMGFLMGKIHPF